MIVNRCLAFVVVALFLAANASAQDKPILSVKVGRYRLQSNPWVNLHQRLLYAARFEPTTPATLSGEDLAKWNKAVETYRAYLGKRSPIFDDELIRLNATLSATSTSKLPASLPKPAAETLEATMPIYRVTQWEEDDRANRFWIAMAEPLLASAAEELAAAHTKAYGVPFPTDILVDVSPFGWEFGAYTVGEGAHAHVVVTSTEPGYQGFKALEMLMHEPSHAIVDGNSKSAIGSDLARASRELNIRPYSNLWHAILFYTAGELTRRALAKRGVSNYQPVILDMYQRGFSGYRKALETHWQAFLDGKISREASIRQILIETAPPKK